MRQNFEWPAGGPSRKEARGSVIHAWDGYEWAVAWLSDDGWHWRDRADPVTTSPAWRRMPAPPELGDGEYGLDVLRPGTRVTVDSGPVVTVVSVIIHGRDEPFAEYDCEWWDDSTLRTARFDRWRLTTMNGDSLKVGFR